MRTPSAFGAHWRVVDLVDYRATAASLDRVDIVVNCFAGPFTSFNLWLPELVAERGLAYLDVCGSYEYSDRLLRLSEVAARCGAMLITALGANPGVPGILLAANRPHFDVIESADIYFTMGSRLCGVSVAGLKELKHMFDVRPLAWLEDRWLPPRPSSRRAYADPPIGRQIYYGAALTRDLLCLPALLPIRQLRCWSGLESLTQMLVMYLGFKLRLTATDGSAERFMRLLRWLGRRPGYTDNLLIDVVCTGTRGDQHLTRHVAVSGNENHVTAMGVAIACEQVAAGKIWKPGAFVGPQIVDVAGFTTALPAYGVRYGETAS